MGIFFNAYCTCIQSNSDSTRITTLPPSPPPPPCQNIHVSQSNSDSTRITTLPHPHHPTTLTPPPSPPLVRVSAYVRVTLTVRVQYADYHPTTLTPPCQNIRVSQSNSDSTRITTLPPSPPLVRVSAYVRVTLTVRVQYADYHPTTLTTPCQSIRVHVCQSNSDSTRTVRGLPLYHPHPPPLVRVSAYVRVTLTVHVQYADYHPTTLALPCQSICVCQSNSDSTRTVRGLPLYLPHHPLSEYPRKSE